jgi:membrane glycosyltransferase
LLVILSHAHLAAHFGTRTKLISSVLLETAVGCLLAPILMAFHTTFVINALLGRRVQWEAQTRDESTLSFREVFQVHAPHTVVGLAVALLVTWQSYGLFLWMSPVLLGLVFSAPLSLLMSSVRIGRRLRDAGLLMTPDELSPPTILQLQRAFLTEKTVRNTAAPHPMVRLIADPLLLRLHLGMLPELSESTVAAPVRDRLLRIALSGGPTRLTRDERLLIMQDPNALRWLHQHVWSDWPVELLQRVAADASKTIETSTA